MRQRNVEEILEALWMAGEDRWAPTVSEILTHAHGDTIESDLENAVRQRLVARSGDDLSFTPMGEKAAREIVRRHRLAERLLHDVLQVSNSFMESSACDFEHILSPEVTDSICTLLGHPTVCPHLRPIPPGPCCGRLARETGPVVRRLSDVPVGETVKVVFIASNQEKRLERLGSLGVSPGSVIRVTQRRPSFILDVDQTSLAMEREVATGIYVRRVLPENGLGDDA